MSQKNHGQRILLVDDQDPFIKSTADVLQRKGFEVHCSAGNEDVIRNLHNVQADLVIFDYEVEALCQTGLFQRLKQANSIPTILLTSQRANADVAGCLDAGFDDVVFKPFDSSELSARIRAVLRRQGNSAVASRPVHDSLSAAEKLCGDLTVDDVHRVIAGTNGDCRVSRTELALLNVLMNSAPEAAPREVLTRRVLRRDWSAGDRTIDVLVSRLRKKVDQVSGFVEIISRRGQGYALCKRQERAQPQS